MDSVAELPACIEEIVSSTILGEGDLLSSPATESEVKSHTHPILDRMTGLPLEISSEIFVLCLPDPPLRRRDLAPILFLNVCRSWTNIALSTPSLWSTVRVQDSSQGGYFEENIAVWLTRCRSHPLSLSLDGVIHPAVHKPLRENAHRIQNLELHISPEDLSRMTMSFPVLHTLLIGKRIPKSESSRVEIYVAVMCAAQRLQKCTLEWVFPRHLALRNLYLGTYIDQHNFSLSSLGILRYVELPALETLYITFFSSTPSALFDFLTRSSPPLQSFSMIDSGGQWSINHFERLFRLVPTLASLTLESPFSQHPSSCYALIDALAGHARSELLPLLRNLRISPFCMDRSHYERMVGLLSARRWQMQKFHLTLTEHPLYLSRPTAGIITALQELVGDGMEIRFRIPDFLRNRSLHLSGKSPSMSCLSRLKSMLNQVCLKFSRCTMAVRLSIRSVPQLIFPLDYVEFDTPLAMARSVI